MKKLYIILATATISMFLYSCEGMNCAEGVVKDKETGQPIDSAQVKVLTSDKDDFFTDSTGKYSVCNRMGGCVPKCADIEVHISKPGYKDVTLDEQKSTDVFLEKL